MTHSQQEAEQLICFFHRLGTAEITGRHQHANRWIGFSAYSHGRNWNRWRTHESPAWTLTSLDFLLPCLRFLSHPLQTCIFRGIYLSIRLMQNKKTVRYKALRKKVLLAYSASVRLPTCLLPRTVKTVTRDSRLKMFGVSGQSHPSLSSAPHTLR